jgi:hypothetical protein
VVSRHKFSKAIEDGQYQDFPLLTDVYAVSHERLRTLIPDASLPNLRRKSVSSLVKVISPLIRKGFDNEDQGVADPKNQGKGGGKHNNEDQGEADPKNQGKGGGKPNNEDQGEANPKNQGEGDPNEETAEDASMAEEADDDLLDDEGTQPTDKPGMGQPTDKPGTGKGTGEKKRHAVLEFLPLRINDEKTVENPMERESSPVKKRQKTGNCPEYQLVDWKSSKRCNENEVPNVKLSIIESASIHQKKIQEAAQAMVKCGHCVAAYLLFHNKMYHEKKLAVANHLLKHLDTREFQQCMTIWKANSRTEKEIPSNALQAFIGVLSVFPWDIFVAALFAGLRGNGNVGCNTTVGTVGHLACKIVSPLNFLASWEVFAKLVREDDLPWNHCNFDRNMYEETVEGGWDATACLLPPILTDLIPEDARDSVVNDVAVCLKYAHRDPFHMLVAKMFKMMLPALFVNDGCSESAAPLKSSDLAKQVFGAQDNDVKFLESLHDNKKVTFSSWRKAFAESLTKAAAESPASPPEVPNTVTLESGGGSPNSPMSPATSHQTPERAMVGGVG